MQDRTAEMPPAFGLFSPIVYPINRRAWEDAASPADVAAVTLAAEHGGFDFVTCGDHGAIPVADLDAYGSGRFYDPIATLGYLAAVTTRIRLATFVYQVHLRSPFITAKALATLDVLAGGRAIAGFGVGSRRIEAAAASVDFARRGRIADEMLEAIRLLWTQEAASFRGEHVQFEDMVCAPRPVQAPHPPIWIAGKRAVSLRRALRFGDAWVMAPWALSLDEARALLDRAREGTSWAARTSPLRVVASIAPLGGRSPRGQAPAPMAEPGDRATERALAEVQQWLDVGATDFVVDLPACSQAQLLEAIEWFAGSVVPVVRNSR